MWLMKKVDLKNPKPNIGKAGFTYEEREKFTELLKSGFVDSFRYFYPDKTGIYSWWSYRFKAREKNAGWRIDYFVVSDDIADKMKMPLFILTLWVPDHCPVELIIDL